MNDVDYGYDWPEYQTEEEAEAQADHEQEVADLRNDDIAIGWGW